MVFLLFIPFFQAVRREWMQLYWCSQQCMYSLLGGKHRQQRGLPYWPLELGRILGWSAWIQILKSWTETPLSWIVSEHWWEQLGSPRWCLALAATAPAHHSLHCEPSLCSDGGATQEQLTLQQNQLSISYSHRQDTGSAMSIPGSSPSLYTNVPRSTDWTTQLSLATDRPTSPYKMNQKYLQ